MASINDNLFTKMVSYSQPHEMGCYLCTRWGLVRVHFKTTGISVLEFEALHSDELGKADSVFRDTFLQWLSHFQSLQSGEQWDYLCLDGTDFQKSVWRALLDVPGGQTASYAAIAEKIGRPRALRAVGSAVGANPVSLLLPCHRIVRSDGQLGNYRWGMDRKQGLLDAEQKKRSQLVDFFL